jgi:class 3 adenylate cyclase/tetratricopeptide (TPR) repeat protein
MECPGCHAHNPDDASFCEECGSRIETKCFSCGEPNRSSAKFCRKCGERLTAVAKADAPAQSKSETPDRYTPKHLAAKILYSRAAMEGERKLVTILFADLKGSMELLADRDPEEAHNLLDPVVERMMDAVHRYEGTVNEVRGDGIMALFGAPLAHEDHALRACYAALDMQAAIQRYAEEVRRSHGVTAQIRIGINSGEVVVRTIGSDLRMDYAAVGQSTHLAARMEQLAHPGSTLLTVDTLRLAEGYIKVKSLGPIPVKGLQAPVDVYELIGTGPVRSRLSAAAARGLTRFVGRDAEVEQIRQILARSAAGHGQVVAIVGEAGVGKSRLVWEVMHSHRTEGWLMVHAGALAYGKATPYLPVVDLLRTYFQIEDRDDHRKIREKVIGKLLILDRTLEPTLPALLALLDVPIDDPAWEVLDPRARRERTLETVKRLLLRESQVQPLLVVFEDLHWIDSETQALLDSLVEGVPTTRLLLLVNYRPEYEQRWGNRTYYTQLRLDPLPPASADELLNALLGSDASLEPLKPLLIERTEGNPFFLEESVQTLVETEILAGERGSYRLVKQAGAIRVPSTVQAMLAARIDRLPAEEKRLLATAAVIGKDVPFALLQAVSDQEELALRQGLAHLQAMEFLYETALFPDLEYTFKHGLTHDVAYGTLLNEQRRQLHGQIAEAMQRLYADRLTEQVDRLAHHAFHGEQWEQAVGYLRQAGAKAAARSAYPEACAYLEQALVALSQLSENREMRQLGVDVRFDLRSALQALGDHERVFDHLRAAEALASELQDQVRLGWASAYLSQYLWRMGDPQRAEEVGQRALDIGRSRGDFALEVVANFFLGQGYFNVGDYVRASEHCRRNVTALKGEHALERFGLTGLPAVLSRMWLAWSLAERGEFAEAMQYASEALSVAETAGQAYSMAAACLSIGQVELVRGALEQAVPTLERSAGLCHSAKLHVILTTTTAVLSLTRALQGHAHETLSMLEESEAHAPEIRIFNTSTAATALGAVYLLAGKTQEAQETAMRTAERTAKHGFRGGQARALYLLGEICARRDPTDGQQAEKHYRQAMDLAGKLAMRPLIAQCHLGLGRFYQRARNTSEAQTHLAQAVEQFREMDMPYWLKQAEEDCR